MASLLRFLRSSLRPQSTLANFPVRRLHVSVPRLHPSLAPTISLMDTSVLTSTQQTVRDSILRICSKFPDSFWAERDRTGEYPHELHTALAADGWIGICLPEESGGAGLGISEATVMLQAIAESGAGMAGAQSIHANIYATQPVAKFGSEKQKKEMLPKLIRGEWRTCFGVTEPNTGLETLKLRTRAVKKGDTYEISGEKIWISSAQIAQKMVLLARTTPLEDVKKPTEGLSLFFIDFDKTKPGLELQRIDKMGARAVDANMVFFDGYTVPSDTVIGKEGEGFKIVMHGMNAERCLLAGEALGLGYAALNRAVSYASERVVFGKPIGQNQGIQHPLAKCWMELEAAKLATYHAASLYDRASTLKKQSEDASTEATESAKDARGADNAPTGKFIGAACNSAKYLAAEAAFKACETAVLTHGGMGYAQDYHVERYLRECFIPRIAPVSREMILNYVGQNVLGLPKSY